MRLKNKCLALIAGAPGMDFVGCKWFAEKVAKVMVVDIDGGYIAE